MTGLACRLRTRDERVVGGDEAEAAGSDLMNTLCAHKRVSVSVRAVSKCCVFKSNDLLSERFSAVYCQANAHAVSTTRRDACARMVQCVRKQRHSPRGTCARTAQTSSERGQSGV